MRRSSTRSRTSPSSTSSPRVTPLDLEETAKRIIARETGGYCFQLNGDLRAAAHRAGLPGEDASRWRARRRTARRCGRQSPGADRAAAAEDPERVWLVDAGLGDGLMRPTPLEAGAMLPGAVRPAGCARSEKVDGWRMDHDPRASLSAWTSRPREVGLDAFAAQHAELSTNPDSPFRRLASVFRRKRDSVVVLRSVGLTETFADRVDDTSSRTRPTTSPSSPTSSTCPLPQLDAAQRDQLWRRVWSQYEDFLAKTSGGIGSA